MIWYYLADEIRLTWTRDHDGDKREKSCNDCVYEHMWSDDDEDDDDINVNVDNDGGGGGEDTDDNWQLSDDPTILILNTKY